MFLTFDVDVMDGFWVIVTPDKHLQHAGTFILGFPSFLCLTARLCEPTPPLLLHPYLE